jgi:hypothetical protein
MTAPPNASAPIWQVDWTQFVPDAVLTVAAGIAIGFWLWRVDRRSQDRAARKAAESRWSVARANFATALTNRGWYNDVTRPDDLWRQFDTFLSLANQYPDLAVWADAAPANGELAKIKRTQIDLPYVKRAANAYMSTLRTRAKEYQSNPSEQRFIVDCAFHLSVGNGWEADTTTGAQAAFRRVDVEPLLQDDTVQTAFADFDKWLTRLRTEYLGLISSLILK